MSDFKPRPGSFTPYLEYMQRRKQAEQRPLSPLTLLEILARQALISLPIPELQTLSGMDPARFREALKSLRDAGFISIDGPQLEEVVQLTKEGWEAGLRTRPV